MSRALPAPCNRELLFGTRLGPTLGDPAYELTLNGEQRRGLARLDVATWADRVHHRATVLAAAQAQP